MFDISMLTALNVCISNYNTNLFTCISSIELQQSDKLPTFQVVGLVDLTWVRESQVVMVTNSIITCQLYFVLSHLVRMTLAVPQHYVAKVALRCSAAQNALIWWLRYIYVWLNVGMSVIFLCTHKLLHIYQFGCLFVNNI